MSESSSNRQAESYLRMLHRSEELLSDFARQTSAPYVKSDAGFMLKNGRSWQPDPRYFFRMPRGLRRGLKGCCFDNAFDTVGYHKEKYLYCEGRAYNIPFEMPFEHAWVVDRSTSLVLDPTLRDVYQYAFFGIALPYEVVEQRFIEFGCVFSCGTDAVFRAEVEKHAWKGIS